MMTSDVLPSIPTSFKNFQVLEQAAYKSKLRAMCDEHGTGAGGSGPVVYYQVDDDMTALSYLRLEGGNFSVAASGVVES